MPMRERNRELGRRRRRKEKRKKLRAKGLLPPAAGAAGKSVKEKPVLKEAPQESPKKEPVAVAAAESKEPAPES